MERSHDGKVTCCDVGDGPSLSVSAAVHNFGDGAADGSAYFSAMARPPAATLPPRPCTAGRGLLRSGGAAFFRSPERRRWRPDAAEEADHGGGESGAVAASRPLISGEEVEDATAKTPVSVDLTGEQRWGGEACRRRRRRRGACAGEDKREVCLFFFNGGPCSFFCFLVL